MAEVQSHGFSWEKDLLQNIYGATEEEIRKIPYTSKSDLPAELNRKDGVNLSIKTTCSPNTICMADCLRVYDSVTSGSPLHMTVIYYKQDTTAKHLQSITEVDLTNSVIPLFGSLTRAHLERLDKAVKKIPAKRSPTREEHHELYRLRDELQALSGAIYLNIKCNSQQSRLQCSFNHFQRFLEKNPERVIGHSKTSSFRGGTVRETVDSGRRVFQRNAFLPT